ncbi:glycoside hydrolase family 1 protein [Bombilactobacillus folatiphilus]|uniref:Glycoside hydrolase family 1 protein n=1 Tax=Bombilactobacillus folatiphilus TaxID=2923362 RepID=A0ABY4P7V9_9LACO|nr:glycoside hydrolase family 1 protein [Bombilactobacillus folatiphilus]UQS81783.1 glycoside hydrolase family 1 protein [Bombilactobacillus folatiphilus]
MHKFADIFDDKDFLWGSGTAAYQCEGAWKADSKGLGEWDYFNHHSPLNINHTDGDEASDFYHHYQEDIDLLAAGHQNTFRFSIAWDRILPNGTGKINQNGIDFYNNVIDYCLQKGLEPNVSLFHYDLPYQLALQGGWLNRKLTDYFADYAKICFENFGDRVKIWVTINEPRYYSYCVNIVGNYPPNRRLDFQSYFQYQYNLMLASAKAIKIFHNLNMDGIIGIVHDNGNVELAPDTKDKARVQKLSDFFYNREILCPALLGKMPDETTEVVQAFNCLLYQTDQDEQIFADGKADYLGLNLYNRQYVTDWSTGETAVFHNNQGKQSTAKEGIRLQGLFESAFDPDVPRNQWGREELPRVMYTALTEINQRYHPQLIMITENGHGGYETPDENGYVNDDKRIALTKDFLKYLLQAKNEGVPVHGYYHWSPIDLYSWINGYEKRYGMIRVDYNDHFRRIPKKSYYWYRDFIDQYFAGRQQQ